MTERVLIGGLSIARVLHDFIVREALPGTGISEWAFWTRLDRLIHDMAPRNRAPLAKRDELQARIDAWHIARKGQAFDLIAYKPFLVEIGYLVSEAPHFTTDTDALYPEISQLP